MRQLKSGALAAAICGLAFAAPASAADLAHAPSYPISPDATVTSLACSPPAVAAGTPTTCTATVTDETTPATPTGTVNFSGVANFVPTSCTLVPAGTGVASCSTTATPPFTGTLPVAAAYGGDPGHTPSRGNASILATPTGTTGPGGPTGVSRDPTKTSLDCEPSALTPGATATCTATVNDTAATGASAPTGTVAFSVPSKWQATVRTCTLAPGTTAASATCQLTFTAGGYGTQRVISSYEGDTTHLASSGFATVTLPGKTGSSGKGHRGPVSGPPGTQCTDPYAIASDPGNRLMLPAAPGSDPLHGAQFFVDGPAHGYAAGAIAQLLGTDPTTKLGTVLPGVPAGESWTTFAATIPGLEATLGNNATIDNQVAMLSKIASEPETQRVSSFSQGGGPGAIYSQTQKLFCDNFTADPGTVPMISTYFLHPDLGGCPTPAEIRNDRPTFHRRVNELAAGTGNRPAVFLVEIDGIGSTGCMHHRGDLNLWLADIRYEAKALMALPHTLVYVEAGYSDANSPRYTAKALKKIGLKNFTGFWTNDTHINWTINEIRWGEKISRMTHGKHFVINTAQNGNGPLLNKHPTTQGVEELCNPPGRGLGPQPTTSTGFPHVDAFIWSAPPGISSGSCHGGTPSGTFWLAHAIAEAGLANARLGPSYPSKPY